jgi:hypothetical protein
MNPPLLHTVRLSPQADSEASPETKLYLCRDLTKLDAIAEVLQPGNDPLGSRVRFAFCSSDDLHSRAVPLRAWSYRRQRCRM